MRLSLSNETATKTYTVTEVEPNRPYLKINENYYLPLTTNSFSDVKMTVESNGSTYRAMVYSSASDSASYYTTSVDPGQMSSTTALTRSSTSGTSYLTRSSTSGTDYGTQAVTTATSYMTRSSTSGTDYGTREVTTGTSYLTRSSTSDTSYITGESTTGETAVTWYTKTIASVLGMNITCAFTDSSSSNRGGSYTSYKSISQPFESYGYLYPSGTFDTSAVKLGTCRFTNATNDSSYIMQWLATALTYDDYYSSTLSTWASAASATSTIFSEESAMAASIKTRYDEDCYRTSTYQYQEAGSWVTYTSELFDGLAIDVTYSSSWESITNPYGSDGTVTVNVSQGRITSMHYYARVADPVASTVYDTIQVTTATSYLTRSSTSGTSYLTSAETTGTTYYTRSSTSNTIYYTDQITTGTTYLTRSSTSGTSYLTRSSTSGYSGISSTSSSMTTWM